MLDNIETSFPPNVVSRTGEPPIIHGEKLFLQRVFRSLQNQMGSPFDEWCFTLHYRHYTEFKGVDVPMFKDSGRKNAMILLADEHERFPIDSTSGFDVVFRQYLNSSERDDRIHAFPVGYHEATGEIELLPFDQRKIRLFFSGYLNRNRLDFYKQFRRVWWLPKNNIPGRHLRELARRMIEKLTKERDFSGAYPDSIIRFTEWFAKGLPPAEYAATLANSQIAVCPTGFISAETIRHWEAMRLGCVIITDPLPSNSFYKDAPMIVMRDWSELRPTLDRLMKNPDELLTLHEATMAWWRDVCCEEAVASYMAAILANH